MEAPRVRDARERGRALVAVRAKDTLRAASLGRALAPRGAAARGRVAAAWNETFYHALIHSGGGPLYLK